MYLRVFDLNPLPIFCVMTPFTSFTSRLTLAIWSVSSYPVSEKRAWGNKRQYKMSNMRWSWWNVKECIMFQGLRERYQPDPRGLASRQLSIIKFDPCHCHTTTLHPECHHWWEWTTHTQCTPADDRQPTNMDSSQILQTNPSTNSCYYRPAKMFFGLNNTFYNLNCC